MAVALPYTYVQCPCATQGPVTGQRAAASAPSGEDEEAEERDLDPRAPRSKYSLYPLEHLLYCEDCQQIRCPRCVLDEIVTWYCPNCLFEVPSSTVRTEGNRCTRSCFECPSCTAPLSVTSLEPPASAALLSAENTGSTGPFILSCPYCAWCSSEVGLQFEKHNGIYGQMYRKPSVMESFPGTREKGVTSDSSQPVLLETLPLGEDQNQGMERATDVQTIEARFAALRSFYQSQITKTSSSGSLGISGDLAYGSPGNFSRIMSLYTSGNLSDPKSKSKLGIMREAETYSEGLRVLPAVDDTIEKLLQHGWTGTTTHAQREEQSGNPRFVKELQPVPYLLRTKRSKRCRTCRHILSKPEAKVQNTRFRIRLVALNYIPTITIKPLPTSQSVSTAAPTSKAMPVPVPRSTPTLTPHKAAHFLLTLRNPIFDPIKVTLATPTHTPGRFPTRTTILCPQFEVGANTDVWDEALQAGGGGGGDATRRRTAARDTSDSLTTPEAGKIWDKGRNWTSVAVEVVPADVFGRAGGEREEVKEDEDVLEIPIFVRLEWESDAAHDEGADVSTSTAGAGKKEGEGKEKRELAYWCVLGVGRIERL